MRDELLLTAILKAAEKRRELLMSVRGATHDGQDRDNLQWRAQAMDDLVVVMRDALSASKPDTRAPTTS